MTDSFWDTQASGQTWSAGGTGKTTAEMQNIQTYRDAGWDFVGEVTDGLHEIWQMPQEGGYPVPAIFNGYIPPQLQGTGTAEDPYLISSAEELGAMAYYHSPRASYRLSASMDLSGIPWHTLVIPWFYGTFDGDGHTISHLTIAGSDCVGLFGRLYGKGVNLGVVDANVVGSGAYVGGLVAYCAGDVANCYGTGAVRGIGGVGGLVGYNRNGTVSRCYSTATVSGRYYVGGLVGEDFFGTVTHCYSTGLVSAAQLVGGLMGRDDGATTQCFWDTQTSAQTKSAAGTGCTTAEMQTAKTFLDAGWDFVGETANGTEDIWWILEGRDYPRLWWELIPES